MHPDAQDRFPAADDLALVLRGEFHGIRVMLCSDLGTPGQTALLDRKEDVRAQVVVTGIPSAGEPVLEELLDAVQPRLIIVCDSQFPSYEQARPPLRERLTRRGIPMLYLSERGSVTLVFDQGGCTVKSMKGTALRVASR